MSERQTPETVERSSDPSRVNKDRAQGWGSDDTKVDAIRTVTLYPRSENPQRAISPFGWLSASILHDLRNPLGTICAGAELLINLDSTSTQVKRLAGNMARAAGRMQQLLAELASLARDNVSTPEICDIRQVIAGAAEAALATPGLNQLLVALARLVGRSLRTPDHGRSQLTLHPYPSYERRIAGVTRSLTRQQPQPSTPEQVPQDRLH